MVDTDLVHIPDGTPALHLGTLDITGPDRYAEGRHAVIGIRLAGIGRPFASWLMPGTDYALGWDGDGWRVLGPAEMAGHTYRLVDKDGALTGHLPLEEIALGVTLTRGQIYRLRHHRIATEHDGDVDRWALEIA